MDLSSMRTSYERGVLDEASAPATPLELFDVWFGQAQEGEVAEPNAMTLSTAGPDLRPSSRTVLIKDYDERGITFFTNYGSRKGRELAANPFAALLFFWQPLQRQVRIEGRVEQVDPAESDAYHALRPVGSRIGAWASPQSEVIAGREVLEANERAMAQLHGDAPPRPPFWGGYRLVPDQWEFWQGRASRLHDRLRYAVAEGGGWQLDRLAP